MIFRKLLIASTGIFLSLFLIIHLSANLILVFPEDIARQAYNAYAAFLADNPLIKIVAYLLYLSILVHIVYATIVTLKNRAGRKESYQKYNTSENSSWSSQNMGLLGLFILIFIIVHLGNFWARAKLGLGNAVPLDEWGNKDLYLLTSEIFNNVYYVIFYAVLSIPLGFHLSHGIKSAFKSIGFYHSKGLQVINKISLTLALIISFGFGIIPIIMFINS